MSATPEPLRHSFALHEAPCGDAESPLPDGQERARAADLFRALGHEVRLHVLLCLSRSSGLTVTELIDRIGIEQSALSHQLRALREARLVQTWRSGRNVYYALYDSHVSHVIEDALSHVREER